MHFKSTVCFFLIVLQFVDARPVINLGILSNKVSNTIYNLNKTQYANDSPLRFSFSLDGYPEETRGVSIRQPALKRFQLVNKFRHPSTYSSGSIQQMYDQQFVTFYRNIGKKVNEFEYPVIDRVKQDEADWLELIDTRLLKIRKRFGEILTGRKNLKNRFHSIDRRGQFFGIPYYTLNEDHTIVKKHDIHVNLEVTGSSDSIVEITEVPSVTLKIEDNLDALMGTPEVTGTPELETEENETTMKSDYMTSLITSVEEEEDAEEVSTVAVTEEMEEILEVTWLPDAEKILPEENIEAIFMDTIMKTDSMNFSLEPTTTSTTSILSFDENTEVVSNLSLVENSTVLTEKTEVESGTTDTLLESEYTRTEDQFAKSERSVRDDIFRFGKTVEDAEELISSRSSLESSTATMDLEEQINASTILDNVSLV